MFAPDGMVVPIFETITVLCISSLPVEHSTPKSVFTITF